MSTMLHDLKTSLLAWAGQAHDKALLPQSVLDEMRSLSARTPANLFDHSERPLVVGFFGGTGVGKSTLLNRLAGDTIARTGVERPTSRDVTVFLHQSVEISHLPDDFPLEHIRRITHSIDENRHILWIDMPDFDSVERGNRQQVTVWLPHIDLLIYVVSPERYRDDNGWRLLLQQGCRHAWCFVINHWDRGNDVQREDFRSMLLAAGLTDPLLFCTDSSADETAIAAQHDEFPALKSTVQSLAERNTIAQLEARGISIRAGEMERTVDAAVIAMGSAANHTALQQKWTTLWQAKSAPLQATLHWKLPALIKPYRNSKPGLLSALVQSVTGRQPAPDTAPDSTQVAVDLFDHDSIKQLQSEIDEVVVLAQDQHVPVAAVRQELTALASSLQAALNSTVQQYLQASLANPGTTLQRWLHGFAGWLSAILPLCAMAWAGYRIVAAFHAGASTPAAYLSSNFAINAGLLVLLAWALPYVVRQKTRPSPRAAAKRGLQKGIAAALDQVGLVANERLQTIAAARDTLEQQAATLFAQAKKPASNPSTNPTLERALLTPSE